MAGTIRSRSLRSNKGDEEDEKGETMRHQPRKMSEIIFRILIKFHLQRQHTLRSSSPTLHGTRALDSIMHGKAIAITRLVKIWESARQRTRFLGKSPQLLI
jgi:hypothetical protein